MSLWTLVNAPDNDHHWECWQDGLEKQDWECWKWEGWKEEFDNYEAMIKQALLAKLRDEVMGLDKYSVHNTGDWVAESNGWLYLVSDVEALLEKAGE